MFSVQVELESVRVIKSLLRPGDKHCVATKAPRECCVINLRVTVKLMAQLYRNFNELFILGNLVED